MLMVLFVKKKPSVFFYYLEVEFIFILSIGPVFLVLMVHFVKKTVCFLLLLGARIYFHIKYWLCISGANGPFHKKKPSAFFYYLELEVIFI